MQDLRILLVIIAPRDGTILPSLMQSCRAAGFEPLVIEAEHGRSVMGTAVLAGATHAARHGYDAMITMEGDGRHDPADIALLAAEARQYGPALILGSPQDIMESSDFWVRLECGQEIPDPSSSFRLYPVKELLALKIDWQSRNFAIESVVRLAWAGLPVIPVALAATASRQKTAKSTLREGLRQVWLHSRLVARRLLPMPHQRFTAEEPLGKKVYDSLAQNPFRVLGQACREHASPLWLALAVWLGIFLGALPLLSIHTITILYVAHRLHVNKVVAVAASQLCTPPFVPWACIQCGYYLRKGELLLDFSWQKWLFEAHERFWEWLIGSLLLGPLLGLLGGALIYWVVLRWQKRGLSYEQ